MRKIKSQRVITTKFQVFQHIHVKKKRKKEKSILDIISGINLCSKKYTFRVN